MIYKYPLNQFQVHKAQTIRLPKGSTLLSAINQQERLAVYAALKDGEPNEVHKVLVQITGADSDTSGRFLGTVSFSNGDYIIHVFELA